MSDTDTTTEAPKVAASVKLGQAVAYISTNGKQKLAFVVGTSDTIDSSDHVPSVESPAHAHLEVHSPTGNVYLRHNVPSADAAEEGQTVNVYREV